MAVLYKLAGREAETADTHRIALHGLPALEPVLARRALRLWIAACTGRADADMAGIERVYQMALDGRTGSRAEVYGGIVAIKEKGSLSLRSRSKTGGSPGAQARQSALGGPAPEREEAAAAARRLYEAPVKPGEAVTLPGGKAAIYAEWVGETPSDSPAIETFVDSYSCAWPAEGPWPVLRYRRPGDWLQMPYGRKKLKDMLVEKGVPRDLRDSLLLLALGPRIMWIPGVAKAEGPYAHQVDGPGPGAAEGVKQLEFTCVFT